MYNFLLGISLLLEEGASSPSCAETFKEQWWLFLILGVMLVILFVLPRFTNRKKQNMYNDMLNNIRPGVTVKTIGGVVGEVVEVKNFSATEKHIVIATGSEENRSYMTFDINAVGAIVTPPGSMPAVDPMPSDEEVQAALSGKGQTAPDVYNSDEPAADAPAAEEAPAADAAPETAEEAPATDDAPEAEAVEKKSSSKKK